MKGRTLQGLYHATNILQHHAKIRLSEIEQAFKFNIDFDFGGKNKPWLKPTIKFNFGFNFCGGFEPWLKPAIKVDTDSNIKFDIEFEFDFGFNIGGGSEPPYM